MHRSRNVDTQPRTLLWISNPQSRKLQGFEEIPGLVRALILHMIIVHVNRIYIQYRVGRVVRDVH
jgi:hypothetical protein